jgi:peptide/nickel transport system permease protein
MTMLVFLVRRLGQAVLVMLAVALIAFTLFNYVGDPIQSMVGQDTSMAAREQMRQDLGLNDSVIVQFSRFIGRAVHGEFGLSYQQGRPVAQMIRETMPATIELSVVSAALALALGIPMGVYTGLHRSSWLSNGMLGVSLAGVSLPTFLIGILLILVFSVDLKWLPSFGRGIVVHFGWWSSGLFTEAGWRAIVLPATNLALFQIALIMRLVRSEMIEVLRTDYIRFARSRGLSNRAVNFGHALKNTLVPVITVAGLQLGSIIAFAIITETVFQWPGMGLMFIQAVSFVDIPVMAAYLLLVGCFFVGINLIVDLLYHAIDPRLRIDRGRVGYG